jgi:hypothetical protein
MTKIMDLVTYRKFKTLCDCNGGPYEYINHIDYTQAQQAYESLQQERDMYKAHCEYLQKIIITHSEICPRIIELTEQYEQEREIEGHDDSTK